MGAVVNDETLQMYVEESKEHLETIESDLLAIEQQGEQIDEELVNKVFRAAHSIKGGGGFLGLDAIKGLSHKIENILDRIRNYQMVPTPDVVSTVLTAFDYLGELLADAVNSNDRDITSHVAALEALTQANLSQDEKAMTSQQEEIVTDDLLTTFTFTELELSQARRGGCNLFVLKYDLIRDVQRQNKTPFSLMKELGELGTILEVKVGVASVGDLDSEEISTLIPMYLLFSTVVEPDLIGMIVGLEEEDIRFLPPAGAEPATPNVPAASAPPQAPPSAPAPMETIAPIAKGVTLTPPVAAVAVAPAKEKEQAPAARPAPPQPEPAKAGATKAGATKAKGSEGQADSLRVSVSVLDQLMNRAGELVLARNQLIQAMNQGDRQSIKAASQRINLVTSELQETIMLTRMQPVGMIFNKFPRVVRDLARNLGKEIELELLGNEVELDKTIIEGLGDPLTHLVRNSADHGIELPGARLAKEKPACGHITLRAFHESGQVIIEIEDDGGGLRFDKIVAKALERGIVTEQQLATMTENEKVNLIMLPGFSTVDAITEVSGRGVGMDVVKTNLDKLGGQIDVRSTVDVGTVIRIKLPLTLAIIPSLLVSSCGQRFALPQVNVGELLRIPANQVRERIDKVGGADVLTLRGELIPLLQLNNVLALQPTYYDAKLGIFREDRRQALIDDRLAREEEARAVAPAPVAVDQAAPERRSSRLSDVCIVILQTGTFKYGMVVSQVHDTIEIVVKPLGRHLKKCQAYAGATIMGDGRVALILDVVGLARHAELRALPEAEKQAVDKRQAESVAAQSTRQSLLLFKNGAEEQCAVPLHLVLRVEQIKASAIEIKGGKKVIQYRGGSLPVYALEEVANVEMLEETASLAVILFVIGGHEVGLLALPPLDVVALDLVVDESTLRQPGISGSAIIQGKTTLLVDIFDFIHTLKPEWLEEQQAADAQRQEQGQGGRKSILLVEDSQFFRSQVKHFMEEAGFAVIEADDGVTALAALEERGSEVSLIVTDIEMPRMNGFELASRVKADDRFGHLKIIALTSLAGEEDANRGKAVGIDDYQIKLDKEKLLQGISRYLGA